jgi:hypothetical protein
MHLKLQETSPTSFGRAGNGPLNAIDPLQIYMFFACGCPHESIPVFIPSICCFLEGASIIAEFTSALFPSSCGKFPKETLVLFAVDCSFTIVSPSFLVQIYIFLEGASQDKVIADFTPTSFDIKLQEVGAKHYRAAVHRFHGKIDPAKSSVIVKPKRVTVVMPKAERKHLTDLYDKEDKVRPTIERTPRYVTRRAPY